MPSLPQVLHEAANQSASEILIEVGKEPVIVTSEGPVSFSGPLSETEVFDSLGSVLAPEQQAELAMGNVVEFHMDVDGSRWTLLTEPSAAGLVLRGRVQGSAKGVEVGTPMDLPPLEPFQPEKPAPAPPPSRRTNRQTRWDLGVPDMSESEETPPPSRSPSRSSQPAWVSEETGGAEPSPAAESDSDASSADFELRIPSPEELPDEPVEQPEASAEEEPAPAQDPEPIPDAPPPFSEPKLGGPAPAEGSLAPPPPVPDAPKIVRNTKDVPLATVPSESDDDDDDELELAQFGRNLGPGSVCLVRGAGAAVRFARHVNGGVFTVIDGHDVGAAMGAAVEDEPGGTYVVRLEDPSTCLGWMLRRLEEGARIVVETRARTMEGARRTLLGVDASARAETWLEAHSLHWLSNNEGAWIMTSGDRR